MHERSEISVYFCPSKCRVHCCQTSYYLEIDLIRGQLKTFCGWPSLVRLKPKYIITYIISWSYSDAKHASFFCTRKTTKLLVLRVCRMLQLFDFLVLQKRLYNITYYADALPWIRVTAQNLFVHVGVLRNISHRFQHPISINLSICRSLRCTGHFHYGPLERNDIVHRTSLEI